jgi:hypothetical protein
VVLGPGTGLGAAQLFWDTGMDTYRVWPGGEGEGRHGLTRADSATAGAQASIASAQCQANVTCRARL